MTAFSTDKASRLAPPTTPDDSRTEKVISNTSMPLHKKIRRLPLRCETFPFTGKKRIDATICDSSSPILPDLDDVYPSLDEVFPSARATIPSLKLKPRLKSHKGRTTKHTKISLRFTKNSSHSDKTLTTPLSKTLPPIQNLLPLRERTELTPNPPMIVGKSLLGRKRIDDSLEMDNQEAMSLENIYMDSCNDPPSKLKLKPRRVKSTTTSSKPMINKENSGRLDLPYLVSG